MPRPLWILVILLAGSLVWAYRLAHPPKERPSAGQDAVEVWRIDPAAIRHITLHSKTGEVTLAPESSEEGAARYVWVTVKQSTRNNPSPSEREREETDDEPAAAVITGFKGNETVAKAVGELASFHAQRRIGELAGLEDEAFGLPAEEQYVVVDRGGEREPLKLELGAYTFGNVSRYVLDTRDGTVYLVRARTLDLLTQGKPRLLDRRLLAHPILAAERVELRMEKNAVTLWKLRSAASGQALWGARRDDAEGESRFQEWIETVSRLRVTDYISDNEQASVTADPPAWEARIFARGESEPGAWMKVFGNPSRGWRAVTSHTRRPVMVDPSLANRTFEMGRKLFAEP